MPIKFLYIIFVLCLGTNKLSAQKHNYRKFGADSCDFKKYPDPKVAQELLCKARHSLSIGSYYNALELLKQSYTKASSAKLKFQILKFTAEAYRQLGDTKAAEHYQEKVSRVLESFPDIEK